MVLFHSPLLESFEGPMRKAAHIAIIASFAALAVGETAAQDAVQAPPPAQDLAAVPAVSADVASSGAPPPEVPEEGGACETRPYSMQITVVGVREARGTITVDVHDD